jgi:glycosyltransferase involved in cell wall biosynthesis
MVSVIIPNFNHSLYLEQRIHSVLNQTYQNFEIIFLDDFSNDNSREIIESYRNNVKVTHISYNDKNSDSPFCQWHKGISLSKGDYIWIAESDDVSDLFFLEKIIKNISSSENLVLSYCATINIDDKDSVIGENNWASELDPILWKNDFITKSKNKVYSYLSFRNIIPNASAVVFRKSSISDFDFNKINQLKYAGDWLFWIHVFSKGGIAFSSDFLNFQRHHTFSTTSKKSLSNEIIRIKEYLSCIKYYHSLTNSSTSFFNNRYDWLFDQIRTNIPFNLKTIVALSGFSKSISFLFRLLISYFK